MWVFNFFWVDGLWQRRLTTEDAEGAESCCALCGGFPNPFRKIIKSLSRIPANAADTAVDDPIEITEPEPGCDCPQSACGAAV